MRTSSVELKKITIRGRPSRHWYIVGSASDGCVRRQIKITTGCTEREDAEAIITQWREDWRNGVADVPMFGTFLAEYHAKRLGTAGVKSSELKNIEDLATEFQDTPVNQVTSNMVQQVVSKLKPNAAPGTKTRVVRLAAAAYGIAHRAGHCPQVTFQNFPEGPRAERAYATMKWLSEFRAALGKWTPNVKVLRANQMDAETYKKHIELAVTFFFSTGVRATEASKLTGSLIDADRASIQAAGRVRKNGKPHRHQLAKRVIELLDDLGWPEGDEKLLPTMQGIDPSGMLNKAIKSVSKASGVQYLTTHCIGGHGCVTHLISQGWSLFEIAQYVGKTTAMLERHYGHLIEGRRTEMAAAF